MAMNMHVRSLCTAATLALTVSTASAQIVYNRGNPGEPETLDPQKTSDLPEFLNQSE
jgi:ABC-type oligopeptide transport system substrate-binding subunit